MDSGADNSLDRRLERLEKGMGDIRAALEQVVEKLDALRPATAGALQKRDAGGETLPGSPAWQPEEPAPEETAWPVSPEQLAARTPPWPAPNLARSGLDRELHVPKFFLTTKFWFNVFGILLVLLGVIFLYKYSVDQGWIDSRMKVASGVALGAILLVAGIFLHERQKLFGQMLAGAGVATFYISGYAAFQVYGLIGYPVAEVWMGAVTLTGYLLAVYQDEQALTIVALVGGLSTPMMLSTGTISRTAMVAYVCGVLAGSAAIYFAKGWRPVLWLSATGGWLSLLFIYYQEPYYRLEAGTTNSDRLSVQAGIIFAGAAFWLLPLVREALAARYPRRWSQPREEPEDAWEKTGKTASLQVHALSVSTPFIALLFSRAVWHLGNQQWGWVTLAVAAVFGLAFLALSMDRALRALAYTQAMVDVALLTMAISLLLNGDARFSALSAEAGALHLASWKLKDRFLSWAAHGLFLFMTIWLGERLLAEATRGTTLINPVALANLLLIILMAAVSFVMDDRDIRHIYQLTSYLLLQALFLKELAPLVNGQAYVTVAWGASAVVLLAAGILMRERLWRQVALAALFVVVAKLLMVDLGAVKAIWRVLLLVGFGALFLTLSYFFQSLWRPDSEKEGFQ